MMEQRRNVQVVLFYGIRLPPITCLVIKLFGEVDTLDKLARVHCVNPDLTRADGKSTKTLTPKVTIMEFQYKKNLADPLRPQS